MTSDNENRAFLAGRRQFLYELLVGVFERLPDRELLGRVQSPEFLAFMRRYGGSKDPELSRGAQTVLRYLESIGAESEEKALSELSVDRTRLLRSTDQSDIRPPYEGLYRKDKSGGGAPLKVKQFYRQAGLLPSENVQESPDYLCLELDFMARLCAREKEDRSAGRSAADTVRLEREFITEHLGNWVEYFCEKAAQSARTEFFRGFLIMLNALINGEKQYLAEIPENHA